MGKDEEDADEAADTVPDLPRPSPVAAMESALQNEEVVAQLGVTRNAECRNVIEEIRMAAKTLGEQLRVSE